MWTVVSYDSAITLLGPHPNGPEQAFTPTLATRVQRSASHIVTKRQAQPGCPPADEGSHTRECHSAVKRTEAPTLAATWVNLKNILLSDRSHTQKTACGLIPFM